jgi:hypothetical protein
VNQFSHGGWGYSSIYSGFKGTGVVPGNSNTVVGINNDVIGNGNGVWGDSNRVSGGSCLGCNCN